MIPMIKADGKSELELIAALKQRSGEVDQKVTAAVIDILEQVKAGGDEAVRDYTIRFDGKAPDTLEVPKEQIEESLTQCDAQFVDALKKAAVNIQDFHARQKQQSWLTTKEDGTILGQRIRGLKRVGIYVPGGTAEMCIRDRCRPIPKP